MANGHKADLVAGRERAAVVDGRAGLRKSKAPRLSIHKADYLKWAESDHPATAFVKDPAVLDRLLAFLGDRPLDQVSTFDLERWRTERAKAVARSTADREFHVIQSFFRQAVAWKRLKASPARVQSKRAPAAGGVSVWKLDEQARRVLSPEELKVALEGLPARYALMCRITLEALPRLSEVLGLTRADIGPDWLLRRLKGGKRLRVGITPALAADLRAEFRSVGQVHLFGDPPPRQEATSSYFTRMFRELKLTGISHHAFRHTGVTLMLDAGRSARAIQQLAGWSSLRMLERYGHVNDEAMRKAVEGNAAYVREVLK